jgi:predicted RNA-binding protein with PIN domain
MRLLIDGYNLMYEVGALGPKLGPDGLRKARHRFLNDLGSKLNPVDAYQTTVVFDSREGPQHLPKEQRQKGMTIFFAQDEESADARIEALIKAHSSPKQLTVVSTDRRIRLAATRRRAKSQTADEFWSSLNVKLSKKKHEAPPPPTAEDRGRRDGLTESESAYWMAEFGHLDKAPETRQALRSADFVPTEEDIARIIREVEREG